MAFKQILEKKAKTKTLILGSDAVMERMPLVCLVIEKNCPVDDLESLIQGLQTLGVRLAIIEKSKKELSEKDTPPTTYYNFDEKEAFAAADIALVFSKEATTIARKNGCVPVAPLHGTSTIAYNPIQEKGNGFYFKNPNKWDIFAAVVRALETYQFPYDWENVVKEAGKIAK